MDYNFSEITDNKKRGEVIQQFIEILKLGNHSTQETIDLRVELVKKALAEK